MMAKTLVKVQASTDDAAATQAIERLRNLDIQAVADGPPVTRWYYTCEWPGCYFPQSSTMPSLDHVSRLAQQHRIEHLTDFTKEIAEGAR